MPDASSEPNSAPPEGTERANSADVREAVLDAVYDLISEHGVDGTTMRMVSGATGLSTGTINYHFGNKRALVIAALEAAYRLPADWASIEGTAEARLRRLLRFHVFRKPSDRWWRFFTEYLAQSLRDDEMRSHLQTRYLRQRRFWAGVLREGIASGEFDAGLDPALTAERLLTTAHGLVVMQILDQDGSSNRRVGQIIDGVIADLRAGRPPVG